MTNLNLSDPVLVEVIGIITFHETVYLFIFLIFFFFQEKLYRHILVRNQTEDTSSRETSPPYFNKKDSHLLYTPITIPSILLYLF
jgi:hypothetical protein